MELLLGITLEDDEYEIKRFPETGTMVIHRKGISGEPDYSVEGDGFVVEFKDGKIYTVDIYDPEVASRAGEKFYLQLSPS